MDIQEREQINRSRKIIEKCYKEAESFYVSISEEPDDYKCETRLQYAIKCTKWRKTQLDCADIFLIKKLLTHIDLENILMFVEKIDEVINSMKQRHTIYYRFIIGTLKRSQKISFV
jgi:hypothetical protein